MIRENFKGLLKMRDISPMWAYRGTLSKMRTCPARCGTLGKYGVHQPIATHENRLHISNFQNKSVSSAFN